jgi:nitrite reductase/ring-hydroxylating ferredoxin subunit/uncharacterized membrane protein
MMFSEMLGGLERLEALDRPAAAARDTVRWVFRNRTVKDALHGVWLGHPLHPALAQLTLGSFTSAAVLDALGAGRRESTTLIATGLAAALPTAAAGWTDYADGHEEQQRVGLVHAATNGTAVACFAAALVLRVRGRDARLLSIAGGVISGLGAYVGGHLAYRRGLGANQGEPVPHIGPGDWRPLGPMADLPDGAPVRRDAGDVPVLVVRRGEDVSVLSDRCTHLSAPMHDGELVCDGASAEITCPWHGSVFRLDDGAVVHGPATAPLPGFESRVVAGIVEARVRAFPGVPAS